MDWATIAGAGIAGVIAGLIGSAIGSWWGAAKVGHRIGLWQQKIEDALREQAQTLQRHEASLETIDARLDAGAERFAKMGVVEAVQVTIREELKEFRTECSQRRSEIYSRVGTNEKGLAAMEARCNQTHRRGSDT